MIQIRLTSLKLSALVATALSLLLVLSASAMAAQPDLEINNPRIRWLPGDLPLAGYMTLHNKGASPIVMTGASCDWFGMVMIHESLKENGQSKMVMRKDFTVAPGATASFAPGGYHLMLMKRLKPIKVGDQIPMTLKFSDGSEMTVTFKVQGATSS